MLQDELTLIYYKGDVVCKSIKLSISDPKLPKIFEDASMELAKASCGDGHEISTVISLLSKMVKSFKVNRSKRVVDPLIPICFGNYPFDFSFKKGGKKFIDKHISLLEMLIDLFKSGNYLHKKHEIEYVEDLFRIIGSTMSFNQNKLNLET
jgi:hypothetical protein